MFKAYLKEMASGKKKKRSKKRGRKHGHVARENRRKSMAAAPDRYREPPQVSAAPAAVLYSADDLAKVKSPYLSNGSRHDKKRFRNAYIKYGIAHEAVMRQRPLGQRVPPKAVIECIKPSLLMYICKYELKRKYRCEDPAMVKAVAVHDWVMGQRKLPLDTEDPDGIAKLKAVKIVINGRDGMKNVQNGFIHIEEIIRHHRVETKESQIIKWICDGIGPERVQTTVKNFLLKNKKSARRARCKLLKFHRKLRKIARRFEDAYELGMQPKERSTNNNNRNRNGG